MSKKNRHQSNDNHELITVQEFAKRQGVTPQAVYKRLKSGLQPFVKRLNNQQFIDFTAFSAANDSTVEQPIQPIKSTVESAGNNTQPLSESERSHSTELIELLRQQIEEKDKQIALLHKQIEQLQGELIAARAGAEERERQLLSIIASEQETNKNNQIIIAHAQALALQESKKKKGLFALFGKKKDKEENSEE